MIFTTYYLFNMNYQKILISDINNINTRKE